MPTVDLERVFFKLEIEDFFAIAGRGRVVVTGRVQTGEIHDKSAVLITNARGVVLHETHILDLDWFDRSRCGEHVTADAGMNVAVIFSNKDHTFLELGYYLVIESKLT